MTNNTALALREAEIIAEDLPDHETAIAAYQAAGLDRRAAFALESRAARIITIGRQGILQIGQELLAARAEAQHGTWAAFLRRAGVEERSALNYIRVAEQFGDAPEVIRALPASALYAMAAPSADPVAVGAIVTEVRAGAPAPTVAEVKQRLTPRPALPADFQAGRERAANLGMGLEMNADGTFMLRGVNGSMGGSAPTWRAMLDLIARKEQAHAELRSGAFTPKSAPAPVLTPRPVAAPRDADDEAEEIAAAPVRPAAPPVLTPLAPAAPPAADRKLLASKRALLAAALQLLDAELATPGPLVVVRQEQAEQAARMFLAAPALNAAAAMLAFSATVE